jgi:hypothetical protein
MSEEEEEEEEITGFPVMNAGTSVMSVNPHVNAALHNLTATGDYTVIPLKSGGEDIILQQNDRLVVPQVETHVYVSGRVRRPGAVSFRPGWSAGKYIRHAGGFARSADRVGVVVMRKYGDRIHTSNVKELEPGDVIVVPEKGTGKNWTLFRETVSIISAFASTILVVITIADRS